MHPKKVKTLGTCRKGRRRIPSDVVQHEETRIKGNREVRGTVKASVLQGDKYCPNLVAYSIYDTRPVHFLSMVCNSIKWIIKSNKVYNLDSGEVKHMDFLRSNHINNYNNTIGVFDISYKLIETYQPAHWLCNRKWW